MKKCNVKLTYKQAKPIIIHKLVPALYKCPYIKDFLERKSNIQTDGKLTFHHNFRSRNPQRKRNRHNLGSVRYLFNFNHIILTMHQQKTGYFHYALVKNRLFTSAENPGEYYSFLTHKFSSNTALKCPYVFHKFFRPLCLPVVKRFVREKLHSVQEMSVHFLQLPTHELYPLLY